MHQLSSDESFHYELLRNIGAARYYGADVSEVLECAGKIEPGNFENFAVEFEALASRVTARAEKIDASKYPVSARDAFFHASTYWRAADFFLHGKPKDRRINDFWVKQTEAFNQAIALLPVPGERLTLKGQGFDIPAIFFRASGDSSAPKPTILLGNGYDGAQEEMLHVCGFAALERGFNVMLFEGPGQPLVRREQNLGFITEWEKVVTPVVDYLCDQPEVHKTRIALVGYSMGGWLAARAAAFEHRLSAVMLIDGVFNVGEAYLNNIGPKLLESFHSGNVDAFDQTISGLVQNPHTPSSLRWGIEQGLWSFNISSAHEYLTRANKMTLEGISHQIKCPVWLGEAADDHFFRGQPQKVKDALGEQATYMKLTAVDGAGGHCHVGATALVNQLIFDWFEDLAAKA